MKRKPINRIKNIEKKLRQTCNVCFTTYQLIESHIRLRSNHHEQCLGKCLEKWNKFLQEHYEERTIVHIAKEERKKDEEEDEPWDNGKA